MKIWIHYKKTYVYKSQTFERKEYKCVSKKSYYLISFCKSNDVLICQQMITSEDWVRVYVIEKKSHLNEWEESENQFLVTHKS